MPNEPTGSQEPQAANQQNTQPAQQGAPQSAKTNEPERDEAWYERELSKVRDEAAKWRTKFRDAESRLSEAKTKEEFEAALEEMRATNKRLERDLLVANIAKGDPANGIPALPDELAAVLKGDTEEEIRAHAEQLRKFVTVPEVPPQALGGGLDGGIGGDDFDPKKAAADYFAGRL